jgi:hypothetical protein
MALIRPNNKALSNITTLPTGITEYNLQETDLPSGSIVQIVHYEEPDHKAYSSGSNTYAYSDYDFFQNCTITAINANPIIRLESLIYFGTNGVDNPYVHNRWYYNINGGSYSWFDSWEEGGGSTESDAFWGGNSVRDGDTAGGVYRTVGIPCVKQAQITCSAGTVINFKLTLQLNAYNAHRINRAHSVNASYPIYGSYAKSTCTLTEIAG